MDKIEQIIKKMTLEQKTSLCAGDGNWKTRSFEELDIPYIRMSDGTSGVRFQVGSDTSSDDDFYTIITGAGFDSEAAVQNTYHATCFPSGSAMACSWDIELQSSVGNAIAHECKRLGINLLLGPGLNTRRHPLAARGFEYYSEDPCLAGDMAAAMVNGVQSNGVGTSAKHFACNNSEYKRTRLDSIVEERALREIYLAAFERVVKKSKPYTIMGSYNKLNGIQACESKYLLTDVLRKEWGFDGIVISDWGAVKNPVEASKAGLDLQMPESAAAYEVLIEAVKKGELDEEIINERCRRILKLVFRLKDNETPAVEVDFKRHHQLAEKAAAETAVLLKNEEGILPLGSCNTTKLAIIGSAAVKPRFQGTGCAIVNAIEIDIPLDEIKKEAGEGISISYAEGYDESNNTNNEMLDKAKSVSEAADTVVIFVSTEIVQEKELHFNREHMGIVENHVRLIEAVAEVNKNIVVVVINGETVTMPWIDKVKAVLDIWYSGQGGGKAVARLLFGKDNPCGKLPVTVPKKLSDTPAYLNFPGENGIHIYNEGIFVGYRYYDKKEMEVQFPFGFGMSYTSFEYSNLKLNKTNINASEKLQVTLTVTNTGICSGKEIVQIYISDLESKLKRPLRELKAFEKIQLEPGESKNVSFILESRDFAYYDPDYNDWVVETGEFEINIGKSSRDICLKDTIFIESKKVYKNTLTPESLFCEIFENEMAQKLFTDFLISRQLVEEHQVDSKLIESFADMFWGISVSMDMFAGNRVTQKMILELVDDFNG